MIDMTTGNLIRIAIERERNTVIRKYCLTKFFFISGISSFVQTVKIIIVSVKVLK